MATKGVVSGIGNKRLASDTNVARAELIQMLLKTFGLIDIRPLRLFAAYYSNVAITIEE